MINDKADYITILKNEVFPKAPRRFALLSLAMGLMLVGLWPAEKEDTQQSSEPVYSSFSDVDPIPLPVTSATGSALHEIVIKPGDTLGKVFSNLGLTTQELEEVLKSCKEAIKLTKLFPGERLMVTVGTEGQMEALSVEIDKAHVLQIERTADKGLTTRVDALALEKVVTFKGAKIQDSFFKAGKRAGLNHKMVLKLAELFAWDIDFALNIHPEDSFRVIYEQVYREGKFIENGPILAAEFVNKGKIYHVVRYTDAHGKSDYYTSEGKSLRKAFLRTPVNFTRISSHFNSKRHHPILHKIRAHKGVDYAAPHGTPVKAAGDGVIQFLGRKGGYGNTIVLNHGRQNSTLYGHLSRFHQTVKPGQRVKQGQVIGYVGRTGLASGDHLHFEFLVNGHHKDPLTVELPQADGISRKDLSGFKRQAQKALALLEQHTPTQFLEDI